MYLEIDGNKVLVTKRRIKNMYLYVRAPEGDLEIRAPYGTPEKAIRDFVISRRDWIYKKRREVSNRTRALPDRILDRSTISLWGVEYDLIIVRGAHSEKEGRRDAHGQDPELLHDQSEELFRGQIPELHHDMATVLFRDKAGRQVLASDVWNKSYEQDRAPDLPDLPDFPDLPDPPGPNLENNTQAGPTITLVLAEGDQEEEAEDLIRAWYRKMLRQQVEIRLPELEAETGLTAGSWTTRWMKSRWGSCNVRTHRICLNDKLGAEPPICLDYVIIHELVHTKVPDHGDRFKSMMDQLMPEWRSIRRALNGKRG